MNVAHIIYIILSALSLGTTLALHGTPRTGEHNFWVTLFATLLGNSLVLLAIYGN